jgi:hypothetical protein
MQGRGQKQDGVDTTTRCSTTQVSYTERNNGLAIFCDFFNVVCQKTLHPTNDLDGLGDGWYECIEDNSLPLTRDLIINTLARWQTNKSMEGLWKIRITAKNPNVSPPTVFQGVPGNPGLHRQHRADGELRNHRRDLQRQPDRGGRLREVPGRDSHGRHGSHECRQSWQPVPRDVGRRLLPRTGVNTHDRPAPSWSRAILFSGSGL